MIMSRGAVKYLTVLYHPFHLLQLPSFPTHTWLTGTCKFTPHMHRAEFSDGSGPKGQVVVYGQTLDSYHALSILDRCGGRGVAGATFVSPPGDAADPLVEVLLQCARQAGIELPSPRPMTLSLLQSMEGSSRPHAFFEVRAL